MNSSLFESLQDIEVVTWHMSRERTQCKMLIFPPCEVVNACYEKKMQISLLRNHVVILGLSEKLV